MRDRSELDDTSGFFRELAQRARRLALDQARMTACSWLCAFFFNARARSEALGKWDDFQKCLVFLSDMTQVAPERVLLPRPVGDETLEQDLLTVCRRAGITSFSETELLKPERLAFDTKDFKLRMLNKYSNFGITTLPGFESLIDTFPAEVSILKSLISQGVEEKEQALFFFGHLRGLGYATSRAILATTDNRILDLVARSIKVFLICEENLYKCGFDGTPACEKTLN